MTRRRYTFAEVRYLLRGILADLILGMALRAAPYPDKEELARVLQGYWIYAIKRAEQTGTPDNTQPSVNQ
jgi:hypothetical protein